MFNEINFKDSSFKDWKKPIYYGDHHIKEIWYGSHLFYPLGYIYSTRVTGRTDAQMAFNFKTRDVYFSGSGNLKIFPFQALVDMTIKTCVKPAGFMPFESSAHAGSAYSFDTGVATGGTLGENWAWNYIFNKGNAWPVVDENGNITRLTGKPRSVDTDHILLGLESAQAHPANSYWDDWDVTRGGWEFNTINDVEIMYNFSGEIADAAGSIRGVGSWSMASPLFSTPSIDWMQRGQIGEAYSNAFKQHSGQLIKFDKGHRYYTDDGLIFEYWLVHDWYPINDLKNYWSSGNGLGGVFLRQNGVTGIQVRVYDGINQGENGLGGIYFTIPFQNLVNCNYHYYGEPYIWERAHNNWDEEKFQKMAAKAAKDGATMVYLSPRSGQLSWQRSTIIEDDQFYAKDGRRASRAELNQLTDNIYTEDILSLLSTTRQKLIETIKTQLGVPHVEEDTYLDVQSLWHSKVDEYWNCSDLAMWAYNEVLNTNYDKNFLFYFEAIEYGEINSDWEIVDELLPGDLVVCISDNPNIYGHVAMLVGINQAIGATNSGVMQTTLDEQIVPGTNVYYIRNKLLSSENEKTLKDKLVLKDVEIQYKESNEGTGGSTLYEQRKRVNNIYAIQFVSGNFIPLPSLGQILFHITCDSAADHQIVNGKTYGNSVADFKGSTVSSRIMLEGPSKIVENGVEKDVTSSVDATLFIDEMPNTLSLSVPSEGFPIKSFLMKKGTATEINNHINWIMIHPN